MQNMQYMRVRVCMHLMKKIIYFYLRRTYLKIQQLSSVFLNFLLIRDYVVQIYYLFYALAEKRRKNWA